MHLWDAPLLASLAPATAQKRQGLTGALRLAHAYAAILDSRFDEVPHLLAQACGPAPRQACHGLEAMSVWWRIELDPFHPSVDSIFESRADVAIEETSARNN